MKSRTRWLSLLTLCLAAAFLAPGPMAPEPALAQATQPSPVLDAARSIYTALFGHAPDSDADCEYALDRPVTGPGGYTATSQQGQAFPIEVLQTAVTSSNDVAGFVPPQGIQRYDIATAIVALQGTWGEIGAVALSAHVVRIDGTDENRITFGAELPADYLELARWNPRSWAMGQFGNAANTEAQQAYQQLQQQESEEPTEIHPFAECAEKCRLKYEPIEQRYRALHDNRVHDALMTLLNAINTAADDFAAAKANALADLLLDLAIANAAMIIGISGAPFTGPAFFLVWWGTVLLYNAALLRAATHYADRVRDAKADCTRAINAAFAAYRAAVQNADDFLALILIQISRDHECCRMKCEGVPCPEGEWPIFDPNQPGQ